MASILGQPRQSGPILGAVPTSLLGGRPTYATMYPPEIVNAQNPLPAYDQRSEEQKAALIAEMFPDLAPTQIVKGVVGAVGDRLSQANQTMHGNPSAVGLYPDAQAPESYARYEAGGMDPSVMVPFAADVAGAAMTGSLAAPGVQGAVGMGVRGKLPPAPKPDISGWRVENITQPDYYSTNRNVRIIAPDGRVASQRTPSIRYTDEQLILEHLGYKEPPAASAKPARPPVQIKEAPELDAPDVNWRGSDLADDGTAASIMKSYGRGKGRVVSGYVDVDTIPLPKGAGITKDGLPTERGGYGWDELQSRGSPPPLKIRIDKNGKVTLMDGNHRLAFWRDRGFSEVPVYAIDERPVTGGKF